MDFFMKREGLAPELRNFTRINKKLISKEPKFDKA